MNSIIAVSTLRYHVHSEKKSHSLQDATHILSDFKPGFLKLLSASTEKGSQSVLEKAYSENMAAVGEGSEDRAALRESDSQG